MKSVGYQGVCINAVGKYYFFQNRQVGKTVFDGVDSKFKIIHCNERDEMSDFIYKQFTLKYGNALLIN